MISQYSPTLLLPKTPFFLKFRRLIERKIVKPLIKKITISISKTKSADIQFYFDILRNSYEGSKGVFQGDAAPLAIKGPWGEGSRLSVRFHYNSVYSFKQYQLLTRFMCETTYSFI